MTIWRITQDEQGYAIRKGRERRTQKCEDLDGALQYLRHRIHGGDRVVLVESDGYETVITRQVAGKHRRR